MSTRRLYEIGADFLALEELLLESGGEWTPDVEALLLENEGNLEAKVDGYAALIREWEADAAKWKEEEARVAGHRKARENAAARLKERLVEQLVAIDRLKVETPRFKVAIQRAAPSVELLVHAEELPERFRRTITTTSADKVGLKAALLEGDLELVDRAILAPGSPFLRIR